MFLVLFLWCKYAKLMEMLGGEAMEKLSHSSIDLAKTQKMTKCTKYWCVYGGLVGSILGFFQPVVSADSWQVNSVEEIVRRIDFFNPFVNNGRRGYCVEYRYGVKY